MSWQITYQCGHNGHINIEPDLHEKLQRDLENIGVELNSSQEIIYVCGVLQGLAYPNSYKNFTGTSTLYPSNASTSLNTKSIPSALIFVTLFIWITAIAI